MKSHLPIEIWRDQLEKNPGVKLIQTIRNPRDTLASYYNFYCMNEAFGAFKGSWEDFFQMAKDKTLFGDYFEFHAEWYPYMRNRKNSLILFFEEMKSDLRGTVKKIAAFLDCKLSAKVLDIIVERTTFQNMSKDPMLIPKFTNFRKDFARRGEVGNWKEYFSKEQIEFVDRKCKDILNPIGLDFEYE